jgi:hypothetical protein
MAQNFEPSLGNNGVELPVDDVRMRRMQREESRSQDG